MTPNKAIMASVSPGEMTGEIETDRYCDECGFNLRTQPVYRDDATRLLLVRCTECGKIHPAQLFTSAPHLWLRRLATLLIFGWIVVILGVTFLLGMLETAMQILTLDELTSGRGGRKEVDYDMEQYRAFMTLVLGVSCAAGFVMITLYTCACHHWKRWAYFIPAMLVPLVPVAITWSMWKYEAPHLLNWGQGYMAANLSAAVAGGLAGAAVGRKAVRGLASLVLPPRARSMLAFLWLADGKKAPATK